MTDRPIIFSAAMVLALLAGRKTQTRRLATSPLAAAAVGDRLWVREGWACHWATDNQAPRDIDPDLWSVRYLVDDTIRPARKDGSLATADQLKRGRPSIHMPRWMSRLTLTITATRIEPLQAISYGDAIAEGVEMESADPPFYYVPGIWPHSLTAVGIEEAGGRHAERSYEKLWSMLHTAEGQRWQDNPDVLVLTFTVAQENIDHATTK
jgi:hypothetical protein